MTKRSSSDKRSSPPLPRTPNAMRHGWLLRAELQRLAKARLERGEAIDWRVWTYISACTIDAVAPGKSRVSSMPNGRPYQGTYWHSWPECAPANFLAEGEHRLGLTLEEIPEEIVCAAEEACRSASKRRWRVFLKGQTIARLLAVTTEERRRLRLRLIAAIDVSRAEQMADAMTRKRERDRVRIERKRRETGAKPRSETIAEQARRMGISPGALRVRLHRERVRCNGFVASDDAAGCNAFVAPSEAAQVADNTRDYGAETAHVTVSSLHKYSEAISFVTPETALAGTESPPADTVTSGRIEVPAPEPVEADDAPTAAIIRFNPKGSRPVFRIENGSLFEHAYLPARRHGARHGNLAIRLDFDVLTSPAPQMVPEPEPAPITSRAEPEVDDESWREWWTQPVEGWREGRLKMRNIVSGKTVTIDLREGCR